MKTLEQKFWSKVRKADGCWTWTGAVDAKDYGELRIRRKRVRAHRLSWSFHVGEIPVGQFVLHHCDNPRCVRPDHLFLGSHADNVQDRVNKRRSAYGERNGMHTHPESRTCGERNGSSKLTNIKVAEIRGLLQTEISISELSRRFHVARAVIRGIRDGSRWTSAAKRGAK